MTYLKCEVYLPESDYEGIVDALNQANILGVGDYDYVHTTSLVTGHWRALEGSNPTIGTIGQRTAQAELKLEFRLKANDLELVRSLICTNHSYEEPVINFIQLID